MATELRSSPHLLAVATLVAALSFPASAYDGFVAPIEEIPVTAPWLAGARSIGMGGAGVAAAEDASAIDINPAALARMRRIEISGGLSKAAGEISGTALGGDFSTDPLSRTRLSSVRFAYPFPTFRGSLVVGISGQCVLGFEDDFVASYEDSVPGQAGVWGQVEDLLSEGGVYAWSLAGAFDASPSVSLGAAVSYWTGDYRRRFVWVAEDIGHVSPLESYRRETATETDVSGFRAKVGGLFYLAEGLSAGVVIESPVTLTFEGMERTRKHYRFDAGAPADSASTTYFSDELTLPFTFAVGAAYSPHDLVALAADVVYTDWSEMTYEGFLYVGDETERVRAYEATTDVRLGAEVTVPTWPLRLRAGYMTRPIAYRGLEIDSDRSYFTLGAGVLIDTIFAVDIAWMKGGFKRSGAGYGYVEDVSESAFLLEAAYRF